MKMDVMTVGKDMARNRRKVMKDGYMTLRIHEMEGLRISGLDNQNVIVLRFQPGLKTMYCLILDARLGLDFLLFWQRLSLFDDLYETPVSLLGPGWLGSL